jgi:hypothetical protein
MPRDTHLFAIRLHRRSLPQDTGKQTRPLPTVAYNFPITIHDGVRRYCCAPAAAYLDNLSGAQTTLQFSVPALEKPSSSDSRSRVCGQPAQWMADEVITALSFYEVA